MDPYENNVVAREEQGSISSKLRTCFPRYNSPVVQVALIGLVCFCCSGMNNALNGIGGGGQVDHTAVNNANTAASTALAVFSIVGGGIYNILGPRLALFTGCSAYALYVGSFLYYNHHHNQPFLIIAGGLAGAGAGFLWSGQGAIMTSYPTEDRKGAYISLFWCIFNLGAVVGGFIPFIFNYHSMEGSVNDETYIAFLVFTSLGTFLTLALLPPHKVVRDDGTRVTLMECSNVYTEAMEILRLFGDWRMLLLVPAAWASTFYYTYQFNNVNGLIFTVRTRGFNNIFYWAVQLVGSVGIGYVLDHAFETRRKRGFLGVGIVALLGTVIWGGGLANQLRYSLDKPLNKLDFKNSGSDYVGPFVLYFSYGLLDSMFQSLCYWVIGALAHDSHTLSRYSGFYKGVQSVGAAVAWQFDSHHISLLGQLIIDWSLVTISYPFLIALVALGVKEKKITSTIDCETGLSNRNASEPESSIQRDYLQGNSASTLPVSKPPGGSESCTE